MYVLVSQLARVSLPVTVRVLPFFTGSGDAFTVSLENRCTRDLAWWSFHTKSFWPRLPASAPAATFQVPARLLV
ncbi:hypothetical protein GCM10010253_48840 [Streptomyces badius]|uniref:Uncharacterized protein n=1 Tax=Streptomyces badius TaxID=1941 RepID=A0ABQ2TFR4_STRBA|nr:hypothetical protein GCM10010253_48840 [Streptomyces badius]